MPAQDNIAQTTPRRPLGGGDPAEDERFLQSSLKQINLVVLEEHCVVVFRNRTAIRLPA